MSQKKVPASVSYSEMQWVAQNIADCDFRVTAMQYQTSDDSPWILSVGETSWRRHLIIESVGNAEAVLSLLPETQTFDDAYGVSSRSAEFTVTLSELIRDKYVGVKRVLRV
jgi:hypothetical protein